MSLGTGILKRIAAVLAVALGRRNPAAGRQGAGPLYAASERVRGGVPEFEPPIKADSSGGRAIRNITRTPGRLHGAPSSSLGDSEAGVADCSSKPFSVFEVSTSADAAVEFSGLGDDGVRTVDQRTILVGLVCL